MKFAPGPEDGGPSSMFHDEGASTDVTGSFVSSRALMTEGNGSRTSPVKEKPERWVRTESLTGGGRVPKIASTRWSDSFREAWKSVVKGTFRFLSWVARR